jgi:hypothetical protein
VVDERLCSKPGGGLLGTQPSDDGELWVSMSHYSGSCQQHDRFVYYYVVRF